MEARSEFRPCPCPGAARSPWPGSRGGRCPWRCDSCGTSIAGREPASTQAFAVAAASQSPSTCSPSTYLTVAAPCLPVAAAPQALTPDPRGWVRRRRATTGAGGVSCLNVLPIVVPTARRLKAQFFHQKRATVTTHQI